MEEERVESWRGRGKLGVRRCVFCGESDLLVSTNRGGMGPREERFPETEPVFEAFSLSNSSNSETFGWSKGGKINNNNDKNNIKKLIAGV